MDVVDVVVGRVCVLLVTCSEGVQADMKSVRKVSVRRGTSLLLNDRRRDSVGDRL